MADKDDVKEGKEFYVDVPAKNEPFFLKGSNSLDWGMQNRLARIFNPDDNHTVMLAVDHGYFLGPTTSLEQPALTIEPLLDHADALMLTRGILRTSVDPQTQTPIVLRVSGGVSIVGEALENEGIVTSMTEALRLNVAAVALSLFIATSSSRSTARSWRSRRCWNCWRSSECWKWRCWGFQLYKWIFCCLRWRRWGRSLQWYCWNWWKWRWKRCSRFTNW